MYRHLLLAFRIRYAELKSALSLGQRIEVYDWVSKALILAPIEICRGAASNLCTKYGVVMMIYADLQHLHAHK